MNRVNFTLIILTFLFFGCEKKISEPQFEQNVFDEIFLTIVDSTYIDQRLYTCFPEQGKTLYDKNGKWIGRDTVGQHQRDLECEIKRTALKKDSLNLIIALGNEGLINDSANLDKYRSSKFIFKHLSELPKDKDIDFAYWKSKYNKFAGAMSFSNINFDNKKESGTLNVSYTCGGKCGLGYLVTIKKIKEKWVVIKVEDTWTS
jgi:hypothetical protein